MNALHLAVVDAHLFRDQTGRFFQRFLCIGVEIGPTTRRSVSLKGLRIKLTILVNHSCHDESDRFLVGVNGDLSKPVTDLITGVQMGCEIGRAHV